MSLYIEKFFQPQTAQKSEMRSPEEAPLTKDPVFQIPHFMRILKEEVTALHGERPPFPLLLQKIESATTPSSVISLLDELEELLDIFEEKEAK